MHSSTSTRYALGICAAFAILAGCSAGGSSPIGSPSGIAPASIGSSPGTTLGLHGKHAKRDANGCVSIQDSTGATYTAAQTGGGNGIDINYSSQSCNIGIYINGSNGPNTLDHTMVNGPFEIGIYFDAAGNGAHEDHTQICVNGSNSDGTCATGSSTSSGTGLDIRNTPKLSADHTSIDGYVSGFATNPCPNSNNNMTVDHTVITNATYPWSYQGGNNNFNFQSGHDSPAFNGQSCAGSGVGAGLPPGGNIYVSDTGNHAIKVILAAGGYTTVNTLNSTINEPGGVALDSSSNLYVGGESDNNVYQILAAGGYSTVHTLGSGFCTPYGAVPDANNNVFVGDSCNHAVKEIPPGCVVAACVVTIGSGFMWPTYVALDASDNVFVSDTSAPAGSSLVKEIVAAGGYTSVHTLGGGFVFNNSQGIALDTNDNVYVADSSNGAVYEIPAADGYSSVNTLASGLSAPSGLAVDPQDNVYYTPYSGSTVVEILAAGGYTTARTLGSGFSGPHGIALQNPAVGPDFWRHHHKAKTKK